MGAPQKGGLDASGIHPLIHPSIPPPQGAYFLPFFFAGFLAAFFFGALHPQVLHMALASFPDQGGDAANTPLS